MNAEAHKLALIRLTKVMLIIFLASVFVYLFVSVLSPLEVLTFLAIVLVGYMMYVIYMIVLDDAKREISDREGKEK